MPLSEDNGKSRPDAELRSASAAATTESAIDTDAPGQSPRRRRPGLVALFPRVEGQAFQSWRLTGPTSLGRDAGSTVRVRDGRVSRHHATVEPRGHGLFVRDLASRHGSFVDGRPIGGEGATAPPGSVLRFGDTLHLVVDDVERYQTPPRAIAGAALGLLRSVVAGPVLSEVWDQAARLAGGKEPVLILGETGSGKECVARMVHGGGRAPFVGLNIAAIPSELFEAELFGHQRGAFTGAVTARPGAFLEASGGVLFLDEIGDLEPASQVKLLRAIDLGQVRPLGATRDVTVSLRIVSATSRDLEQASVSGQFRADLWYRLSAQLLRVPPLRARREDVILLALQILGELAPCPRLSADAAQILLLAAWEGNARQLRHVLTRAIDAARAERADEIRPGHLPPLNPAIPDEGGLTVERIQAALAKSDGVALRAAKLLGVSRATFYNAMTRLGIKRR